MNTLALDWRTHPRLLFTCVLAFVASTGVTLLWCGAACDMPGMGTWDRMPGQGWLEHFLVFEGMWIVMMIAMMMPVFSPALLRLRATFAGPASQSRRCALSFAGAYFMVWALLGVVIYPLGIAASLAGSQSAHWNQALSLAGGLVVTLSGWLQFTATKRRQIACCRAMPTLLRRTSFGPLEGWSAKAWHQGWRTGVNCAACCAGLTATLLVVGVMDLVAMAAVTVGIAAERLLPPHARMAAAVGWILLGLGVFLLAGALSWG